MREDWEFARVALSCHLDVRNALCHSVWKSHLGRAVTVRRW